MAYLTDLVAIRDAYVAELLAEMQRRAALVEAGNPPPTTHSLAGKSVPWNEYLRTMTDLIKEWNDIVIKTGGEGLPHESLHLYT